jgi:hypothetical protein
LDGPKESGHTTLGLEDLKKDNEDYKLNEFMKVFRIMSAPRYDVDGELSVYEKDLIEELLHKKEFKDTKEIKYFKNKAMQKGLIYEHKEGVYRSAEYD